jgi:phage shock protein C
MTCSRCSREIDADSVFCRFCGAAVHEVSPWVPGTRLLRSTTDRKIGGVCGGLAEYFGVDSTVMRVAAVILAIYPGAVICGVLVYAIGWLVIPSAPAATLEPSPSTS